MSHRIALPDDLPLILSLMEEFYAEDRISFDAGRAQRALAVLLAQPERGSVFLFTDEAVPGSHGFMVVILGFTLEHGGVYGLLDELYLQPPLRGRGLAKEALRLARDYAALQGAEALRLEVHHHNASAKEIYAKAGYQDDHRALMTLWL